VLFCCCGKASAAVVSEVLLCGDVVLRDISGKWEVRGAFFKCSRCCGQPAARCCCMALWCCATSARWELRRAFVTLLRFGRQQWCRGVAAGWNAQLGHLPLRVTPRAEFAAPQVVKQLRLLQLALLLCFFPLLPLSTTVCVILSSRCDVLEVVEPHCCASLVTLFTLFSALAQCIRNTSHRAPTCLATRPRLMSPVSATACLLNNHRRYCAAC
jgi:hypothetical protein